MSEDITINENTINENTTLVVVSKIKKFIRDKSGLNTASDFIDALSAIVTRTCESAIERAKTDGRKTVMARDL
jgi:histone H3/H4